MQLPLEPEPEKPSSKPALKQSKLTGFFQGNTQSSTADRRDPPALASSSESTKARTQPKRSRSNSRRRFSPSYRLTRDDLRDIADTTLAALDAGEYLPPGYKEPYNLTEKIDDTNSETEYCAPDDPEFEKWGTFDFQPRQTRIVVSECSTLVGARKLHDYVHALEHKIVGVLNFASAKKPGGGFLSGSQAQEESLARVSTLYYSLKCDTAKPFYAHHARDPNNHMYNHAMVYSPGVVLMRGDRGEWQTPVEVDILTSAAVNAGEVRKYVEWQIKMRDVRARYRDFQEMEAKARAQERAQFEEEQLRNKTKLRDAGRSARARAAAEYRRKNGDVEMGDAEGAGLDPAAIPLPPSPPVCSAEIEADPLVNEADPVVKPDTAASPQKRAPSEGEVDANLKTHDAPQPPSLKEVLALTELKIEAEMKERIARLLYLFYIKEARHLVLGSFGTGVFQNKVELVARIFYDLIAKPGAKFYGVFDNIVFAILGSDTVKVFKDVFADVAVEEPDEVDDTVMDLDSADEVTTQDSPLDKAGRYKILTERVNSLGVKEDSEGQPSQKKITSESIVHNDADTESTPAPIPEAPSPGREDANC